MYFKKQKKKYIENYELTNSQLDKIKKKIVKGSTGPYRERHFKKRKKNNINNRKLYCNYRK